MILCLKIISDNQLSPVGNIQPKQVAGLIKAHLALIESLLTQVVATAASITVSEPKLFEPLIQRYHFTVNERMQLKNQLSRWDSMTDHQSLEFDSAPFNSGKDVLRWLDLKMNNTDFYL
jgi:hypothetical protein